MSVATGNRTLFYHMQEERPTKWAMLWHNPSFFSATSDIGDMTTTLVPGSCSFSSHGTNTRGSTYYSSTLESFSDCQSRCQLDTRCNGFTHNSLENLEDNCRLHETSESQSDGLCFSCTFVSKNCIPSISEYEKSSNILCV